MAGKTVALAGVGAMGSGIAHVAAQGGWTVRMFDEIDGAAGRGKDRVAGFLKRGVDKGRMPAAERDAILERMIICETFESSLDGVDLFIEAVLEDLAVKRDLFARADAAAPASAILTTNTSSLSVTAIAAATSRPEQVAGMHFFNPPPLMRLVEVVRGDQTSDETIDRVSAIAAEWGKTAAVAKDTPGFIVNRCARSYYGESLKMLGENLTDFQTIDRIMTGIGGFRMGPFQLLDLVGIEVNFAVTQSVYNAYFQEARFRPSPIQRKMVDAGLLGRKTGRGFYSYDKS